MDMFTLSLSRLVPEKSFTYLSSFVPGLFLEISILIGDPSVIHTMLCRLRSVFSLNPYLELSIALFMAFIIGTALMLFVCPGLQTLTCYTYRLGTFVWRLLCRWIFLPTLSWLVKRPLWRRQFLMNALVYSQDRAFGFAPGALTNAYRIWRALARKLLKNRYGIELDDVREEWFTLFAVLGTPTPEEMRGFTFAIAVHAAGWAGLAAAFLFAPELQTKAFLSLCLLMIFSGVYHDFYVARRRCNPQGVAWVNTRALLREYRRPPTARFPRKPIK